MGEFDLNLGLENLLDDNEIMSLLDNSSDEVTQENEEKEDKEEKEDTAEGFDIGELENDPESVGRKEDNKDTGGDTPSQEGGVSPDKFFSSIATALVDEGIFPDLDEDTVKNIKTAEDFRDAIKAQLDAERTEQENRIKNALENGVEPDVIKQYENLLGYLESVGPKIDEESDEADEIRRRLIYQDYINRGFSKERAQRNVDKAFADGTDKEDAKEALKGNQEFYSSAYNNILAKKQAEADNLVKEREERAKRIKKTITEDNIKMFGDMDIPKSVRQSAYDAISKPVFKDPQTGEFMTAFQKLEHDNPEEFMAKLGLIYALTDGLSNLDKLVGGKVKKEVKKGLSNLENVLSGTSRDASGNLKFVSSDDRSFASNKVKYPDFKTL